MIDINMLDRKLDFSESQVKEDMANLLALSIKLRRHYDFDTVYDMLWFLAVHSQFRPLFERLEKKADELGGY